MLKIMVRNWKTTLAGILTLVSGVAPIWAPPEIAQKVQQTGMVVAIAFGLMSAKDSNVSGPPPLVIKPPDVKVVAVATEFDVKPVDPAKEN